MYENESLLESEGDRGAKLALDLLGRTDKMLGVILLGNNLLNAATATMVSVITIELFGEEKWALSIGTLLVTFAILVFAEITPKILGAAHADQLARVLAFLIWPLLRAAYPVVWFVNLFATTSSNGPMPGSLQSNNTNAAQSNTAPYSSSISRPAPNSLGRLNNPATK